MATEQIIDGDKAVEHQEEQIDVTNLIKMLSIQMANEGTQIQAQIKELENNLTKKIEKSEVEQEKKLIKTEFKIKQEFENRIQPMENKVQLLETDIDTIRIECSADKNSVKTNISQVIDEVDRLNNDVSFLNKEIRQLNIERNKTKELIAKPNLLLQTHLALINVSSFDELLQISRELESSKVAIDNFQPPSRKKNPNLLEPDLVYVCPEKVVVSAAEINNVSSECPQVGKNRSFQEVKHSIVFGDDDKAISEGIIELGNALQLDPYGLVGQWITDALNASVYTYEVAPVFTLMETFVIREMCNMIGPEWHDGMFCPGGSNGNGIALNLARFHFNRDIKKMGTSLSPRLVLFISEEAHYSTQKFAGFIGIGEDNVVLVETDEYGKMNPTHLEDCVQEQINQEGVPFAVVATLGTTVRGAFDPLYEISSVCKKYKLWLHVDAAWGGGLIFSQKHRAKLNGIETADSVLINPHKLLAAPQQCSILFVKDERILYECHSKGAEYLFQKDKYYNQSYDPGDKYLQCGRKCDVFKFWLMWKAKGSSGFAKHVDAIMDVAEYFEKQVEIRPEFQLVSKRQYINVCFWYLPQYLRKKKNVMDYSIQLHKVRNNWVQSKLLLKNNDNLLSQAEVARLSLQLANIEPLYNLFSQVQDDIETTSNNLEIEYAETSAFEDKYFTLISVAKVYLTNYDSTAVKSRSPNVLGVQSDLRSVTFTAESSRANSPDSGVKKQHIKLPSIELPTFNGNPETCRLRPEWYLIPEHSLQFTGLWEAGIKSAEH
ncbi:hypothetical protein RN001_000200 [Aquatica leii]|uniref:Glutamate decarboxylase n=1 Tax=Aquatica leii TaxID=1421715 RepID=A0AAN7PEL6_9COLE|nr:hypothetical protein RN001_000200 [Aquatica leii]